MMGLEIITTGVRNTNPLEKKVVLLYHLRGSPI